MRSPDSCTNTDRFESIYYVAELLGICPLHLPFVRETRIPSSPGQTAYPFASRLWAYSAWEAQHAEIGGPMVTITTNIKPKDKSRHRDNQKTRLSIVQASPGFTTQQQTTPNKPKQPQTTAYNRIQPQQPQCKNVAISLHSMPNSDSKKQQANYD
jgi:hypothetical protein